MCVKKIKDSVSIMYVQFYMHDKSLYRGSYMSVHVLLNLLNELGKRDKMRGLSSKFNNTKARMLDSIYHMTLRLL